MLVQENAVLRSDPIFQAIARVNGNNSDEHMIKVGIYKINHFGSSAFLRGKYEQYPVFGSIENLYPEGDDRNEDCGYRGSYGVCDNVEQLLVHYPELEASTERKFVVCVTPIIRANQPTDGGWRWHKWGSYIGIQKPQHEYLYDEMNIEQVFVFHIYEQKA